FSFISAVHPDLSLKWSATLRNRFHDGCGVPRAQGGVLPPDGTPGGCRIGANHGVDPSTNRPGDGLVNDGSTSSPIVAPDGTVFYGAFSRVPYFQGHMMHFDAQGNYLGDYPFGWDTTPALYRHDGTYSIVTKENRYGGTGSYCFDDNFCPLDRSEQKAPGYKEDYRITPISPNLHVEWSFIASHPGSCSRHPTR